MLMYISVDKNNRISAVSDHPIFITGQQNKECSGDISLLGQITKPPLKEIKDLRIAFICNWNDPCGISTYSKFLVGEMEKLVTEIRIFSEHDCWHRGKSMKTAIEHVLAWKPDFVIIQHEFGIFPNACFFLQMLDMLEDTPYVVCMHSVYEHFDKTVCSAAIKTCIVHTEQGKNILESRGHTNKVHVIPHGCLGFTDTKEQWNIFHTPYAIVQFGFGFYYKGVDRAIDAIHILKNDPKFKDIFYVYLASENPHNARIHDSYHNFLSDKIKELNLQDNIAIIRGFQSEQTINNYLKTAKLAIFPYMNNDNNIVYGASGAIRIAMANRIPIIASESHLFDDLDGIVPRPDCAESLARAIDDVFSSEKKRKEILVKCSEFVDNNSWSLSASRYLELYLNQKK